MYRHEIKYYINKRDAYMLMLYLKHFMRPDPNADSNGEYWIRSIYFDTQGNRDYYQKLNGDAERKKLRVRIYDTSDLKARLEIKYKSGQLVSKEGLWISKEAACLLIKNDYRFLLDINNKTALKLFGLFQSELLRPVIIIDYVRWAYFLPYDNIRVTLDRDLMASCDFAHAFDNAIARVSVQNEHLLILEIKYGNALPGFIKSILSELSSQLHSISKYVLSRQAIHY